MTITGAGGIGKTALALHWTRNNMDRFPDGHLYVNLRGYDPSRAPLSSETAARGFLDALGVDASGIPIDPESQAGLYRSLIEGLRILIVLDNARDASQILPLLPGSSTCLVIITSRDRLSGLVVSHGAQRLPLDVLNGTDARELLVARLGAQRVGTEPDAVEQLLACCGGYPLALSIVAGRADAHPNFPLGVLAAELHDAATRLGALDDGDPLSSLPAVLSWSTAALTPDQANVFGLLGLAPGPDIGLAAVASLTGWPVREVERHLRSLERVSLIQQHLPRRYRMHELVRLYAADSTRSPYTLADRNSAMRRLVDFYVHTGCIAEKILDPHRGSIELGEPVFDVQLESLTQEAEALAWFEAERSCLLSIQQMSMQNGWHSVVWRIAWALTSFHWRRGYLHDQLTAWKTALTAAELLADPVALAQARRNLGRTCTRIGHLEEAIDHLQHALNITRQNGDRTGQAHTHRLLAAAWEAHGDDHQALHHAVQALNLFQGIDAPVWEADAFNLIGLYSARLAQYDKAHPSLTHALKIFQLHEYRLGEAFTLKNLGYLALRTGDHIQATDYYSKALHLFQTLAHAYHEADTLDCLAEINCKVGKYDQACNMWQQALAIYRTQNRTVNTSRIQQRLAEHATR